MIKVILIDEKKADPLDLISHAALTCYQPENPKMGDRIDVKSRLFDVSHHTTLQHSYFTFAIEGLSVADITFGLHLTAPFYNSDQRSGRYCKQMFEPLDESGRDGFTDYITTIWSTVTGERLQRVLDYIETGNRIYHANIEAATKQAEVFLKEERPLADEKYLKGAPKIAQEQLRNFLPVIAPTALDYTVNLSALVALWESAFTPSMRLITDCMVDEVLARHSSLGFMFNRARRRTSDWAMKTVGLGQYIGKNPIALLVELSDLPLFRRLSPELMTPVDKLHFTPELMDCNIPEIASIVQLSVATMGQDQRHRTLRRSEPVFTGGFYLPPIPAALGLAGEGLRLMSMWLDLSKELPETLAMTLAPYGSMVTYHKKGSMLAIAHEMGKRLCWQAQSEIYELSRQLRSKIERKAVIPDVLHLFEPPCYTTGKCAEGDRYCRRNLSLRKDGDFFPYRKV